MTEGKKPRKRRVFYYYALQFKYQFEFDDDTVYFSFAKPYTYSEILSDLHKKEKSLMPRKDELSKQNQLNKNKSGK